MVEGDIKFEVLKKIATTGFRTRNISNLQNLDATSPPSIFIGSKLKYPLVNVGILSPLEKDENAWLYDDAKYWAEKNFDIKDVVNLRDNLLNSRAKTNVHEAKMEDKFIKIAQEIAIASKPVDVEIQLKKGVEFKRNKDQVTTPHSLNASLKQARITCNVSVNLHLEKMMNDDIKASDAMNILHKKSFTEYALSKILSVGVLGMKKNKKLVPTRWSITATDDSLSKNMLEEIRRYKTIENYELFFGEFLGNCYLILLMPGVWTYELFEMYLPGSSWNPGNEIKASTDYENFDGRKDYASHCVGGYYAARLPIVEYLESKKRQASVLAIRIETPTYWAALGVWVVRESVRKALQKKMEFNTFEEAKESMRKIGMIKYGFDPDKIFKKSILLNTVKTQKKLGEFF